MSNIHDAVTIGDEVDFARAHIFLARTRLRSIEQALDRVEIDRAHHKNTDGREAVANALRRTQRVLDALSEDDAEAWDGGTPHAFSLYQKAR